MSCCNSVAFNRSSSYLKIKSKVSYCTGVLNFRNRFLKVDIVERAGLQLRNLFNEVVAAWPQSVQKPELAQLETVFVLDFEVLVQLYLDGE